MPTRMDLARIPTDRGTSRARPFTASRCRLAPAVANSLRLGPHHQNTHPPLLPPSGFAAARKHCTRRCRVGTFGRSRLRFPARRAREILVRDLQRAYGFPTALAIRTSSARPLHRRVELLRFAQESLSRQACRPRPQSNRAPASMLASSCNLQATISAFGRLAILARSAPRSSCTPMEIRALQDALGRASGPERARPELGLGLLPTALGRGAVAGEPERLPLHAPLSLRAEPPVRGAGRAALGVDSCVRPLKDRPHSPRELTPSNVCFFGCNSIPQPPWNQRLERSASAASLLSVCSAKWRALYR